MNFLKKDVKWCWSEDCSNAFEILKQKLISDPILRLPDPRSEFTTDASGYALGAILAQHDDLNREYVCAYASRTLHGAEVFYSITEKECLAVVWGVKHFHVYLVGVHFRIMTDHSALSWLMQLRNQVTRLVRWSIYLQAYDFEIQHRKGRIQSNVDCLSRPVL
jgi:hypothetical protein